MFAPPQASPSRFPSQIWICSCMLKNHLPFDLLFHGSSYSPCPVKGTCTPRPVRAWSFVTCHPGAVGCTIGHESAPDRSQFRAQKVGVPPHAQRVCVLRFSARRGAAEVKEATAHALGAQEQCGLRGKVGQHLPVSCLFQALLHSIKI